MTAADALVALVHAARRRTARSVTLDGACIALSAGLATASAIEMSGDESFSVAGALAAWIAAAAAGATWWLEHRRDAREVVRKVDATLAQNGALISAFERRDAVEPLAQLHVERVSSALPSDAKKRVGQRPHPVLLGLAFACGAAWFTVRERAPRVPDDVRNIVARAALAVARASTPTGAPAETNAATDVVELTSLATSLAALDRPRGEAQALSAELRHAESQLAAAIEDLDAAGEQGRAAELEAARELVEAALTRLEGPTASERSAQRGGGTARDPSSALKNGAPGSTMGGSARDSRSPATESFPGIEPPTNVPREVGTVAGRWWPREYDDVVAAWLEARGQ